MGLSHQGFVFVVMWLGYGGFGAHYFCFVHVVYLQLSFLLLSMFVYFQLQKSLFLSSCLGMPNANLATLYLFSH